MGFVYSFASGSKDERDQLGGKGANLAEMTNLGLPVPPGFTITTEACRAYLRDGGDPEGLADEVSEHLSALEETMGRQLGGADDPLLVSVRSGAKFSLPGLVETFKGIIRDRAGLEFPQDPRVQMDLAMRAVFDSGNTDRARLYRRQERIPEDLGTAVNIQAMVFGNFGMDSGSGVAFTRDPASGAQGEYGDYLQNAQGEDVVAGIRNTVSLAAFAEVDQSSHDQLLAIMVRLERHFRDMCDIEFTVERGKLWMLQTRVGKRTPEAAFRIAVHMVDEGLIQMDEAVLRVTGDQLAQLMFPRFDESADRTLLAKGMNASPGAAVGKVVFDSDTAVEWAGRGEDVILVRKETNPDDLRGMVAARGILTSRGGKTSHAAVVARGMGRTCVCGAEALDVNAKKRKV